MEVKITNENGVQLSEQNVEILGSTDSAGNPIKIIVIPSENAPENAE